MKFTVRNLYNQAGIALVCAPQIEKTINRLFKELQLEGR